MYLKIRLLVKVLSTMDIAKKAYDTFWDRKWKSLRSISFLFVYLLVSYIFYAHNERWSFFDITYFIVVTVSTLGMDCVGKRVIVLNTTSFYGDICSS